MTGLSQEWRAMLAGMFCCTIFGFSFIFSRIAFAVAPLSVVLANRFFAAWLALSVMACSGRFSFRLRSKRWPRLLLLALFEPLIYFLCESWGVQLTNASFSAVMIALIPIFSLLFGTLFLHEKASLAQTLFALLSISGVILISLIGSNNGTVSLLGFLALLGAIAAAVGFNVISRWISDEFSPFERTYAAFTMGFIFFTFLALAENQGDIQALLQPWHTPNFVVPVLYLGLLSSATAYMLYNYALTYLTITRASIFANWTTVVSVCAGVVFLQEPFGPAQAAGCLMILVGLYGVNRSPRKAVHQKQEAALSAEK